MKEGVGSHERVVDSVHDDLDTPDDVLDHSRQSIDLIWCDQTGQSETRIIEMQYAATGIPGDQDAELDTVDPGWNDVIVAHHHVSRPVDTAGEWVPLNHRHRVALMRERETRVGFVERDDL